jgi:hypothetical protein
VSVILSILSHPFYSQSFFLFSVIPSILSHSLSLTPPVGPFSLLFLLRRNSFPKSPASHSPWARTPRQRRRPTSSGPTPLRTLIPALQPEDPRTAAPFFFRSGHLGSTVVQPPRRASDRQIPHKSSAAPPRSFPSQVFVFRARHHRDFAKKPPPVSCSAAQFPRRRPVPGCPNPVAPLQEHPKPTRGD